MDKRKTSRGFDIVTFTDLYDAKCSIQESSLASQDAIWLGIDDPNPQILVSDARRLGVNVDNDIHAVATGWQSCPIPKEVSLTTRMHLNRKQAKAIVRILNKFIRTGSIN